VKRTPAQIIGPDAINQLAFEGYSVVASEPTIEMVEAGFRKGMRCVPKYVREIIESWAPNAGAKHPHEPGLVSALREAIKAGSSDPGCTD
jgi:hypothetical protein